jgi:hypothetical protein
LQQRSVRREATTPARRKISVVTQNPMVVGGLDEQSSSRAAAAFSLSLARWIARPGKGTRHARGGQAREARGRWSCCQPRHVRVLLDRESWFVYGFEMDWINIYIYIYLFCHDFRKINSWKFLRNIHLPLYLTVTGSCRRTPWR